MHATAFPTVAPLQTVHAQERTLERLRISLGQIQQMLEANAYVNFGRGNADPGRSCLVLFSPQDDFHVIVWLAVQSSCILTAMPFSFQDEYFRSKKSDAFIDRRLRQAKLLSMGWLARLGQPLSAPVPEQVALKPAPTNCVKVNIRLKPCDTRPQIALVLGPDDELKFGLKTVCDQRSLHRKLNELMENTDFLRLVEANLFADKVSLEHLEDVRAQISIDGVFRRTIGMETSHLDCLISDLEFHVRNDPGPAAISEVLDCAVLASALPFSFSVDTSVAS